MRNAGIGSIDGLLGVRAVLLTAPPPPCILMASEDLCWAALGFGSFVEPSLKPGHWLQLPFAPGLSLPLRSCREPAYWWELMKGTKPQSLGFQAEQKAGLRALGSSQAPVVASEGQVGVGADGWDHRA